ncbi:hypothetical protein GCM10027048_43920 [Hymenobacter coalescens]
MARPSRRSDSFVAAVRRYFGLTLEELGHYLGVGKSLLSHLEAGRRQPSSTVLLRLLPLLEQLPAEAHAPAASAPPVAPPEPPPAIAPEAGPLLARIDECRHSAAQVRRELGALQDSLRVARRWQQALPALLAAPPALPTAEEAVHHARARRWLVRRAEDATQVLSGAQYTVRYHLLTARAEALEAEAAALARWLPAADER